MGTGAYAINKYLKVNKRIKQNIGNWSASNAGRAPTGFKLDQIIKQSTDTENDLENQKFQKWFRPENRKLPRYSGGRGIVRQKVKDVVSNIISRKKHPALYRGAMKIGKSAADYIHLRLTDPAELNKQIKNIRSARKRSWMSRP